MYYISHEIFAPLEYHEISEVFDGVQMLRV